jgi:hypothetical protein
VAAHGAGHVQARFGSDTHRRSAGGCVVQGSKGHMSSKHVKKNNATISTSMAFF